MATISQSQAGKQLQRKSRIQLWLSRILGILYGLVMIEVVIMISPFAFYFYAGYAPTLNWLNHFKATAWLTGFLLPHAVLTTSPFLEFLRWDLGRYTFGLGLLAFLLLAGQIYVSKLLKRKMVSSGIYRYIRHPQYLCLGLAAFGLFTMWPRVIIFVLFIGMLFTYYHLARVEERRMLAIDPGYAEYMGKTGMFLPGNPGKHLYQKLFGGWRDQGLARRLAIVGLLGFVVLVVFGLHAYTVRSISVIEVSNFQVVSVYPMPAITMRQLVSPALQDPLVEEALRREGNATFIAHILPRDYGMMGMFADVGSRHMGPKRVRLGNFRYLCKWLLPFVDSHSRTQTMGSEGEQYRIVFSRVDDPRGLPVSPGHVFDLTSKMTPVYIADVDGAKQHTTRTLSPPHRNFWGDVKMPTF